LPLSGNGKVDKKRLPAPEGPGHSVAAGVAPRNETEARLVALWEAVLGREHLGVTDDFFLVGGHSINAMRVLFKVRKEFAVDLVIDELFANPTVEALAREIARKQWLQGSHTAPTGEAITITI
jgi:acyl carrier protein